MNKSVALTGANGFLGGSLLHFLTREQYAVKALVHHAPKEVLPGIEYHNFDLGKKLPETLLHGIDCLVHCAWHMNSDHKSIMKINIEGTRLLADQSHHAGIKKRIFISSYSAHNEAISPYGKAKLSAEKAFDAPNDLVLKPGLVIGPGGLAKGMADFIRKSKFIPMIDGGKQPLRIIDYRDICEIILEGIERNISGMYFVAHPTPYSIKAFSAEVARKMGKKIYPINMPFPFIAFVFKVLRLLKMPSPFSFERLLGLKAIRDFEPCDLEKTFCLKSRPLEEAISGILE